MSDLLFELGCEELPSAAVKALADALRSNFTSILEKAGLAYENIQSFAAPRRLALKVEALAAEQRGSSVLRKGPAKQAAFDEQGQPTQALLGFARSCGVEFTDLSVQETDKGEWMVYESFQEGKKTIELLPEFIEQAVKQLPVSKPMRWGKGEHEFVRPVHWAVLLYGNELVHAEFLGLKTAAISHGHRFHAPQAIEIKSPGSYEEQLYQSHVVADYQKRRQLIVEQVEAIAREKQAKAIMPESLIDEVCSIVEWPHALLVPFDKTFLEVPKEALIASMQSHQKCFALQNQNGDLLPCFITVANIDSQDEQQVIAGNEKVMRARLSDADFFYRQDRKRPLASLTPMTEQVVFQNKLGTLAEKAERVASLMKQWIHSLELDEEQAYRAAELSKCDLMTGMVGEFPELQGLMGYYYALNDGEDEAVAKAMFEQYLPRFSGDELPKTRLGTALSLADRLDTLTGIFAIGQKPSGVKDPFKLRRHALALVRILSEMPARFQLSVLIEDSMHSYADKLEMPAELPSSLKQFIIERLMAWYQSMGFRKDQVQAVLACQDEWLYDLHQRIHALQVFEQLPEAAALAAACKRVNNILAKAETIEKDVAENLLEDQAEKDLHQQLNALKKELAPLYASADYQQILSKLAGLRDVVDRFFDEVMVMAEDDRMKNNRLALLSKLQSMLMAVADISHLQG